MKMTRKIFALMMALLMTAVVGLTACNSEDMPDDGQNPVMNYVGFYQCDRASVFIEAQGDDGAGAFVTWGSSAWENSTWTMTGTFDPATLTFEFHDCARTDYVYDDNGDVKSQEEVYMNGHGFITFAEGDPVTLTWQDDQEHVADGMVFEYTENGPEAETTGVANPWTTAESAEAAAKSAGLDGFTVPEGMTISLGEVKVNEYRCMKGIADADIEFPAVGMLIRKGTRDNEMDEGDISGDYNEYKYDWNVQVGDFEVSCFGNREGEATKTIWHDGTYDYAILVEGLGGDTDYGLPAEDVTALVSGIQ